ncbi:NADPH-dependent FMN reductase [Isoalcanivorax indicus]|uniref:NADPH-dependent FMN reductase n=1 Tax=Isoalcanivorax indicus TaxID=2202653 RepID=UPI000DBAAEC0|nr:NAD(P)H-dependent oxidoreductase [Isoalcanivorax indicus]
MKQAHRIAVIYGSTREGRLADRVGAWVRGQLGEHAGLEIDVIDPLSEALPAHHEAQDSPALQRVQARLAAADAFLVLTPEYNHSFPAALKFLIDSVYDAWQAKPVGFVSYGGQSGGLRAVEQLRQVFAELHAMTVRDAVAFVNVWEQFADGGALYAPARSARAFHRMLDQLLWWSKALKDARNDDDYARVA